ncbi:MAG TPA: hypothetical protein VE999_05515 [Gemmataceae bacterium]|nr:hypothetical protein [Gemmataceae bacterium]
MSAFRWHFLLFGLAVACVFFLELHPSEAIAADWKERLFTEAPPKWEALEQYYSKMEVSFRDFYTETPNFPAEFPEITYFDIRKNGDWMSSKLRVVGKGSDGKRMDRLKVHGVNSRYMFALGKASPDAESFTLSNFQTATDEARRKVHAHGEHSFGIVYEVPSWDSLPLVKFIKQPSVTITAVQGLRRGGKELVQLRYERQQEAPDHSRGTEHGTVLLDPERYWCLCECHSELPVFAPASKIDWLVEYGDDVDGFPILRRTQSTATYRDGKGKLADITEFDKIVHRDIPESEFTLSAFGMPELQLPGEQKPRVLWRWLIGIGIALGVIAILLRRYVKNKRQAKKIA